MCSGDSPQENARAEKEVGEVKSQMRRMILASKAPLSFWPLAFRQAVEQRHRAQLCQLGICLPELLPFGSVAAVRRKEWHHRADPFRWPMMKVRLWGPCGDMAASSQGYFVQSQDGRFLRSTVVKVPSKVADQTDLNQPVEEDQHGPEHQGEHQPLQPGRLPGGEEVVLKEAAGEVVNAGDKLSEEQSDQVNLEDIEFLKELAKKAEVGMEGLSQMTSGIRLQEEDKRNVFEIVPHDAPHKRCRGKTAPGQVAGQPMVFKVGIDEGRSASNNWDGDSCSVAGQLSTMMGREGNDVWEHVMLKQHVGLWKWTNEVAGMVNCGGLQPRRSCSQLEMPGMRLGFWRTCWRKLRLDRFEKLNRLKFFRQEP